MDINLVLLKNNGSHKAFPLASNVTIIGRRHECDLYIPLPTVSRRHCELTRNGDSLEVHDLDSTCGTFVNDQKVNGQTVLKAGDYLRVGPLVFCCQIDGKPDKIVPPKKVPAKAAKPVAKAAAKPQKKPAKPAADEPVEDSFADLDASDSFLKLDESDSGLDDLKDL